MPYRHSSAGSLPTALGDALTANGVPATEGGLIHEFEQRGYSLWLSGPDTHIRSEGYRWMVTLRDYDGHTEPSIAYGESAIIAMAKAFVSISSSAFSPEQDAGHSS